MIAVQRDRATRGGSKWVHENLRPGDVLTVNGPRNNFPLSEAAASSLLIAGGIGITPIMSMLERLSIAKQRSGSSSTARASGPKRRSSTGSPPSASG